MHIHNCAEACPAVEPARNGSAKVHAAVAHGPPEVIVPVRAVQRLARRIEVLHVEHVRQLVIVTGRLVAPFHRLLGQAPVYFHTPRSVSFLPLPVEASVTITGLPSSYAVTTCCEMLTFTHLPLKR